MFIKNILKNSGNLVFWKGKYTNFLMSLDTCIIETRNVFHFPERNSTIKDSILYNHIFIMGVSEVLMVAIEIYWIHLFCG